MSAVNNAEFAPTAGQMGVKDELVAAIAAQMAKYEDVKKDGLSAFNALANKLQVPHVK